MSVGPNKQFEILTSGCGNLWWVLLIMFWDFKDYATGILIDRFY